MTRHQFAGGDERFVRRYDTEDAWTVAADLGVPDETVDIDIVGSTAIVVTERAGRPVETELELPGTDATVALKNGVLVITGQR